MWGKRIMALPALTALDVPLLMDETGTIRIGRTRVILDLVVAAFKKVTRLSRSLSVMTA
jgi:hypothetical protein